MGDFEQLNKKLGENIISLRKKHGLSQIDLSVLLNIEDSALRRIEKGRTNPTLKTLNSIAENLNVKLSELLDV